MTTTNVVDLAAHRSAVPVAKTESVITQNLRYRQECDGPFWQRFAGNLKAIRGRLGISESEAADAFGITLLTYVRWEEGKRARVPHLGLINFCERYGISIDSLFDPVRQKLPGGGKLTNKAPAPPAAAEIRTRYVDAVEQTVGILEDLMPKLHALHEVMKILAGNKDEAVS